MLKKKPIFFSIGGGAEIVVVCQIIQTMYFDSSATSEGIGKLAGIEFEPCVSHECKKLRLQRLTNFLPLPKISTKALYFYNENKKELLQK